MNKTQITLIITGFIILALMATNPSIEDHREGVKKIYKEKLTELNKDKKDDLATQIGTGIGMLIGDGFIDKIVSRENYLLFSLTKVPTGQYQTKYIGIGILGQVFVQDYEKIDSEQSNINISSGFKSNDWSGEYRAISDEYYSSFNLTINKNSSFQGADYSYELLVMANQPFLITGYAIKDNEDMLSFYYEKLEEGNLWFDDNLDRLDRSKAIFYLEKKGSVYNAINGNWEINKYLISQFSKK